jgi:hypothetical protein
MKKKILLLILLLSVTLSNAHEIHKFYVSIFLIENNTQRKELEITARIFIDDLEKALETNYGIKANIGTKNQIKDVQKYIDAYLNTNVSLSINKQTKPLKNLGYELENDILICYLTVDYTNKIENIQVKNTLLTNIYSEQQNIMHFTINEKKSSILLTKSKTTDFLQF